MKLSHLLLLAIAIFSLSTTAFGQEKAEKQRTLPDVNVKTLDGQQISIKDFAEDGKITVLSFWATWCSPCKKELDAIADIYPDWQEEYDVEVVAVTIDTQRALAKVKPMVEAKGWEYTVLSDANQELRQALNFQTIPQTFLLDKDGNIIYAHSGYVPGDEYELEDKIKEASKK
jgi:peroxiredoxin